jgi:hypothetical protein
VFDHSPHCGDSRLFGQRNCDATEDSREKTGGFDGFTEIGEAQRRACA